MCDDELAVRVWPYSANVTNLAIMQLGPSRVQLPNSRHHSTKSVPAHTPPPQKISLPMLGSMQGLQSQGLQQQNQQQQQQQQQQDIPQDGPSIGREEASGSGKRKRDPESDTNGLVTKKSKLNVADSVEDPGVQQDKRASSVISQPKRDREHTSIIVKGLPSDATEIRIRQFFRDCGRIKSLSMKPEQNSITATLEFETPEDALFAQTRQSKPFDGALIDIAIGAGATLFVSNYPPEADEAYIRKLFEDYGEIIDIRLPSLKFNTHRRFCYIQFTTPEEAQAATRLDGKAIGKLHLLVKISNPGAQKAREGAIEEGREVYVANVDWHAKEDEIKELFSKFGGVETVRIPKNMKGQSKGVAFVVFKTKVSNSTDSLMQI